MFDNFINNLIKKSDIYNELHRTSINQSNRINAIANKYGREITNLKREVLVVKEETHSYKDERYTEIRNEIPGGKHVSEHDTKYTFTLLKDGSVKITKVGAEPFRITIKSKEAVKSLTKFLDEIPK